jgi:hypothetical protein
LLPKADSYADAISHSHTHTHSFTNSHSHTYSYTDGNFFSRTSTNSKCNIWRQQEENYDHLHQGQDCREDQWNFSQVSTGI